MITLLATIFVFGMLIFAHELGHFIVAKATGMRVKEFALGFGPALIKFRYGETLYAIRIIPLGGYNQIDGMDPDDEQDERSFNAKPIWARMAVLVSGSLMNLLLPIVLFATVFLAVGIDKPSDAPIIGEVMPGMAAAGAGLQTGDQITAVNNQSIWSWQQFVAITKASADQQLTVAYERQGKSGVVQIVPVFDKKSNRGLIGVIPTLINYRLGIVEALSQSTFFTISICREMLTGLYDMIFGSAPADISGPVGIIRMTGEVAQQGFMPILRFAAFLSINLGIINLLPLPVLDGGHIIMLTIEGIRRKPLPANSIRYIQYAGIAILIGIMVFATIKDILRWDQM